MPTVPFRAYRTVFDARAVNVWTDSEMLRVLLADGREIAIPLKWFPRLFQATEKQQAGWKIIGGGVGISWQEIDEDLEVSSLLRIK